MYCVLLVQSQFLTVYCELLEQSQFGLYVFCDQNCLFQGCFYFFIFFYFGIVTKVLDLCWIFFLGGGVGGSKCKSLVFKLFMKRV